MITNAMKWGCRSFEAGRKATENPFPSGTSHAEDWNAGWIAALRVTSLDINRLASKVYEDSAMMAQIVTRPLSGQEAGLQAKLKRMYSLPEEPA